MFGISGTELLIILFFGFLIFGPDKLPQIGRTVGRAIKQFRDASEAANKKFKEEVADPFHEAIAPYKDQMEESTKPIQEDINAINQTFNETKSMFTDPFKDVFKTDAKPAAQKGAVISGVATDAPVASEAAAAEVGDAANSNAGADESVAAAATAGGDVPDPFAGVIDDGSAKEPAASDGDAAAEATASDANTDTPAQKPEGKPLPDKGGKVKKSMASALYGLDDAKDGE